MEQLAKLKTMDAKDLFINDAEFRQWFESYRRWYDDDVCKRKFMYDEVELVSSDDEVMREFFSSWKHTNDKHYNTEAEMEKRYQIFKSNARRIYDFNQSRHNRFYYGKKILAKESDLEFHEGYDLMKPSPSHDSVLPACHTNWDSEVHAYNKYHLRQKDMYLNDAEYREETDSMCSVTSFSSEPPSFAYKEEDLVSVNDDRLEDLFNRWKVHHNVSYKDKREEKKRFRIFKDNAREIYEHNKSSYAMFFGGWARLNNRADMKCNEGALLNSESDDSESDDSDSDGSPSPSTKKTEMDIEDMHKTACGRFKHVAVKN